MRWPAAWKDPSLLDLLRDSPINYLLAANRDSAQRLTAEAASRGLRITVSPEPPASVDVVKGDWPGTKVAAPGESDRTVSGPTGEPWIDSNGWRVLLNQALHPRRDTWVEALPAEPRLYPESYVAGVADAAAHGARWIVQLDAKLASAIAAGNAASLTTWNRLLSAARFFADWRWPGMRELALVGVVSDFTGANEYMSQEALNLLARANQQYRVLPAAGLSATSLSDLKAVLYIDRSPPSATLRTLLSNFVQQGGLLIAGVVWGAPTGAPENAGYFPKYDIRQNGKGRIAIPHQAEDDPYLLVQDAMVLISHRYDLLRFWNGGAVRACLASSPDRRKALLQLVFYANARAGDATIRVAGAYRTARLFTLDGAAKDVPLLPEKGAVELHLPAVAQYGAVELDA